MKSCNFTCIYYFTNRMKDFGAASQLIYVVQTSEGQAMSELLSELTDVMGKINKLAGANKPKSDGDICTKLVLFEINLPPYDTNSNRNEAEHSEVHKSECTDNAEDDLDTGAFDDTQFHNGCTLECPSPRSLDCPSPRPLDCPSPRPLDCPSPRPLDCPSPRSIMEYTSPRTLECPPSPRPVSTEAGKVSSSEGSRDNNRLVGCHAMIDKLIKRSVCIMTSKALLTALELNLALRYNHPGIPLAYANYMHACMHLFYAVCLSTSHQHLLKHLGRKSCFHHFKTQLSQYPCQLTCILICQALLGLDMLHFHGQTLNLLVNKEERNLNLQMPKR